MLGTSTTPSGTPPGRGTCPGGLSSLPLRGARPPRVVVPAGSSVGKLTTTGMDFPDWLPTLIGSVGAVCTTGAFVPQVVRVWRLKRADEISLVTFLAFAVGTSVWLVYGFLIDSIPVTSRTASL